MFSKNGSFMNSAFSANQSWASAQNNDLMSIILQQRQFFAALFKNNASSIPNSAFDNKASGCGMYVVDHKKLESEYSPIIEKYSKKYGVDPDVAKAMARQESGFNPNAVSKCGAKGMFQLMDGTAKDMGVNDSFNPEQNIEGGVKYLSQLLKRYDGDYRKAVAAYNGGMANVDKNGVDFCAETRNYHRAILGEVKKNELV